ncbi:hypothetical protein [Breznakia pachnodae]|uniref:Uncharacterized protein n=1 Tax=Breznakia pachnodae TaxID=265178 RepID=A0ABU0E4V5_9FIRM|nr:hypothetical protein [Breznakia pachnodae]MDQ0361845.1 hypothetical protein [Breznakia pachnodae]
MKLDFYYWSYQCPLNNEMLKLLEEYKDSLDINIYDINENQMLAKEQHMFFPTLIVVNNQHRYFSPLRRHFLDLLLLSELPKEKPYIPVISFQVAFERIIPLTDMNCHIASQCSGSCNADSSKRKATFLHHSNQDIYGFLNVDNENRLLGGVEYLSSMLVPYDIPKHKESAFITCIYDCDDSYDYKSKPLEELENYLCNEYKDVYVISDEESTFPNGNLEFFLRNGYEDLGIVNEENNYCKLHLLRKVLK